MALTCTLSTMTGKLRFMPQPTTARTNIARFGELPSAALPPILLADACFSCPSILGLQLLLQHKANIHARDYDGWTPLLLAAANQNWGTVELVRRCWWGPFVGPCA